jgi:hypothetical protein
VNIRHAKNGCDFLTVAGGSTGNRAVAVFGDAVPFDLPAFLLDIVTDGRRTDHCRDRVAGANLHGAGHQTAEP